MKIKIWLFLSLIIALVACTGKSGVDGVDGKSAKEVDTDSLALYIRNNIMEELWDSIQSEAVLDSVYDTIFSSSFHKIWMDSTKQALVDSLLDNAYDSLYNALYETVYDDIYKKSLNKLFQSYIYRKKEAFNGAFANHYPIMYKDDSNAVLEVRVKNTDTQWHYITVKTWIPEYSDTGNVTLVLNPGKTESFGPEINFIPEKLLKITASTPVQVQVRAYVLENNLEILIFSESYLANIEPMQLMGPEYLGVDLTLWQNVWVTPNMDSISSIHSEMSKIMPSYGGYQLFGYDSMEESINKQVQTVYEVLRDKGIQYVSNTTVGSSGQKIKYPIEVLRTKQANCIEGALLFASILESIGIDVAIVDVPGHAFIAWKTEKESSKLNFLETTLAWNETPVSFEDAVSFAVESYEKEVELGNFDSEKSRIVYVSEARKEGITPNAIP